MKCLLVMPLPFNTVGEGMLLDCPACLFVHSSDRTHQSTARQAALTGRSRAGAVQAVCNGSLMSTEQGTTVHKRLLCPYLGHYSLATLAGCRQLLVLRHHRSMFDRRAFSVAGPVAWNSLPDYLRDPTHC